MNKDIVLIKWLDIESLKNDSRDRYNHLPIHYTFGIWYCIYKYNRLKIVRLLTDFENTREGEIDNPMDDFIDLPMGCIVEKYKLGEVEIEDGNILNYKRLMPEEAIKEFKREFNK